MNPAWNQPHFRILLWVLPWRHMYRRVRFWQKQRSAMPGTNCWVLKIGLNWEYKINLTFIEADGTWTDEPRCIEHEPGQPTQRTGWCPGIPGYCSLSPPGSLCEFDCLIGADISSSCKPDGTWDPYPTCEGDIRQDYIFGTFRVK